jgi:hypothetical protein
MKKRKVKSKQRPPAAATVESKPATWMVRHSCWLIPFVLFLVVRMFSADSYYQLMGDQCTYLEMGRTFPKHQLYNHELYLIHPPAFGYAIGLFHLFLPLLTAGLVATLLFACVNFFVVGKIAQFENLPRTSIFAGLACLALSRPAAAYDSMVWRASILVCATAFALLAFLRLLREPSRKALIWAIAANAVCLAISDQALLLLPCEAVVLWIRGSRLEWRKLALLAGVSGAAALVWPIVRLIEFTHRADLPAGIDGMIEFTKDFPLLAFVQPNFLPFTNAHRSLFTQTSLSLGNLNLVFLFNLPLDLLVIPRVVSAVVLILLVAAAFAQARSRRRALQWLTLTVLFLLPVGVGMNEWYGMGFIIPFSLLIMEGAAVCFAWAGSFLRDPDKTLSIGMSLACTLAAVLWLAAKPVQSRAFASPQGGTHFLFARPTVTRAAEVSRFFASMPREVGIMAPQGLSPEVVYLTDKRVVAIPFYAELLDTFIEKYHISYLLTSSEYLTVHAVPRVDLFTSRLVTLYIFDHPERYRLVRTVPETYPAFYPPLEYYVFQVQDRASAATPMTRPAL